MAWIERGWYLVVEFERSTSGLYKDAVALAESHPSYCQLMDHRGQVFHRVLLRPGDVALAWDLLDIVKQWRGVRVFFKGDPVPASRVQPHLRCYRWRMEDGELDMCPLAPKEGWPFPTQLGCDWGAVTLWWTSRHQYNAHARYWFEVGQMVSNNILVIDKDRLVQRVTREQKWHGLCPVFDATRLGEIVERLPSLINLRTSPEWRTATREEMRQTLLRHDVDRAFDRLPPARPAGPKAYAGYMTRILDGLQWDGKVHMPEPEPAAP